MDSVLNGVARESIKSELWDVWTSLRWVDSHKIAVSNQKPARPFDMLRVVNHVEPRSGSTFTS